MSVRQNQKISKQSSGGDNSTAASVVVDAPWKTAQQIIDRAAGRIVTLGRKLYQHSNGVYCSISDAKLEAEIYKFLAESNHARLRRLVEPNSRMVSEIIRSIKARTYTDGVPPFWLVSSPYATGDIIAFKNGLLHRPTGHFLPPTDEYFNLQSRNIAYDSNAPQPVGWKRFIDSLWPEGDEPKRLQEVMGYLLTSETAQQKVICFLGPAASGKSKIGEVMQHIVGPDNYCSPDMYSLGSRLN